MVNDSGRATFLPQELPSRKKPLITPQPPLIPVSPVSPYSSSLAPLPAVLRLRPKFFTKPVVVLFKLVPLAIFLAPLVFRTAAASTAAAAAAASASASASAITAATTTAAAAAAAAATAAAAARARVL